MSNQDQSTLNLGAGPKREDLEADSIWDTIKVMPELSKFTGMLREQGLDATLQAPDWMTLFAPSDEALGGSTLDREQLLRHIVRGSQINADLRTTQELETISGEKLPVEFQSEGSIVGGARIVRANLACPNGKIHIIDKPIER